MTTPFNAYTCPLDGANLVEAGAGTGKTYNIQVLVLRLVLAGTDVRKILVVTFTDAATAELRDRVHRILGAMRDALGKLVSQDPKEHQDIIAGLDDQLRGFFQDESPAAGEGWRRDLPGALKKVKDALRNFDQAPISTIHGFCHRMLNENAFESGIRYGLEPRTDISAVTNDIIHDFARTLLYQAGALRVRICTTLHINPDTLLAAIQPVARNIGTTIDWGLEPAALNDPEQALANQEKTVGDLLEQIKADEFWKLCPAIPDHLLNKNAADSLSPSALAAFRDLLRRDTPIEEGHFRAFTTSSMAAGINKAKSQGKTLAEEITTGAGRAFTAPFDALATALPRYRTLVHYLSAQYFQTQLAIRKCRDNFLTFNDMLTELDNRLQSQDGDRLAEVIRAKYDCALVDEFQDTDPVQYNIFNRIFKQSSHHAFFMIGDPKQAIYSFRGGDIFAYLKACQDIPAERRFTLATNYRSANAYIDALNTFYEGATPPPFARDDIAFTTIIKPAGNAKTFTRAAQTIANPLTICTFTKKDLAAEDIVAKLIATVADPDLAICLDGVSRRPRYSDIAVLVRTGNDGNAIESLLQNQGIPVVWTNAGNIFWTLEADELLDLMTAITHYNDSSLITKVLASRLFAATADDLLALRNAMPAIQLYFEQLHELWSKKSFLAMFRVFLEQPHRNGRPWLSGVNPVAFPEADNLAQLLARQHNGDRTLTNFLHLGEKLHQTATQRSLGPESLITFLKNRSRNSSDAACDSGEHDEDDEALALRMATQNDAVLIMTLHKSKGLQFPFVFLPHLPAVTPDERDILYHDEEGNRCLDLTPSHAHQDACAKEALQETLRILYVGLTRAIFACHVAYAAKTSPLSPHAHLLSRLTPWLTDPTPAAATLAPPPPPTANQLHPAMAFTDQDAGRLQPGWRTCSFTSLATSTPPPTNLLPDPAGATAPTIRPGDGETEVAQGGQLDDEDDEADDTMNMAGPAAGPPVTATGGGAIPFPDREPIFQFPAGKRAGLFWHSIFENLDFQSRDDNLETALTAQLDLYSLLPEQPARRERQRQAFITMTKGILHNTLPDGFQLADVPPTRRLTELRFLYRLRNGFHSTKLAAVLRQHGLAAPERWNTTCPPGTAMTGSIDLLFRAPNHKFYLLDWKTNCLDGDPANFGAAGLQAEMDAKFYHLQYLIYTVAFAEFHRSRTGQAITSDIYEDIFGGVFYLFVRGITPEPEATTPPRGVFFTRPPFALIESLHEHIGIAATPAWTELTHRPQ